MSCKLWGYAGVKSQSNAYTVVRRFVYVNYVLTYIRPAFILICSTRAQGVLLVFTGRDEFGETLATLVFAQRAMSITVKAHQNVAPDLEARCQDLQQNLDSKSDELIHMTARKTAAEEVCRTRQYYCGTCTLQPFHNYCFTLHCF